MAHYTPLKHPSSSSIAMEQLPYSAKTPTPFSQKESFMDDFTLAHPSLLEPRPRRKPNMLATAGKFVWKTLFLPVMAIAYLAFCYVCHYRLVRVGGISNSVEHLSIIKSGVTSIGILFVSLSLFPLYSLISDLKSEEFFRALSIKQAGAPLNSVNNISTPSYGMRDSLVTLYRRHGSNYFAGAFFAGFVALAASTLAPAALSVDIVLFDGDLVAFSVGAIQRNSVMNASDFAHPSQLGASSTAMVKSSIGGAVAWAEFTLGVNSSFQSPTIDQTAYMIPAPVKLTPGTSGRWLSDVIATKPSCEWIAPVFQSTGANFSDFSTNNSIVMNLTSQNIQVTVDPTTSGFSGDTKSLKPLMPTWFSGLGGGGNDVVDLDTMDALTNGESLWMMLQCVAGCDTFNDQSINVTFGSDVPSSRYNDADGKAVDVTFLFCAPNAEIETRQIRNDGQGFLSIGDKVSTSQGNLHPVQSKLLLSYAFNNFDEAGPSTATNISTLGNQVQFSFVFGNPDASATQLAPQPINVISQSYGRILKSAVKPFMDGSMASAYVPGRTTQEIVVFASSLPHVIASTALYLVLSAFVLLCHFRRHVPQFTFFAVAAALARSDIPPLFAQLKESDQGPASQDGSVPALGNARVLFEGGQVLKLRSGM